MFFFHPDTAVPMMTLNVVRPEKRVSQDKDCSTWEVSLVRKHVVAKHLFPRYVYLGVVAVDLQ